MVKGDNRISILLFVSKLRDSTQLHLESIEVRVWVFC